MTTWDTDYLPPSLCELVDVIGLQAAQSLVSEYGGVRLTVPTKMPEDHPLAELLGIDAARKLSHHYAQERLDVPNAKAAIMAVRNKQMREDHADGMSARQLARRENLTERRVWEILSEGVHDDRQVDMFNQP
jgi:hypothetical protein